MMQLGIPARVRRVLRGERLHRLGREAREAADIAAYLIAQHRHRIGGPSGSVVPTLDRGGPEADLQAC